MKSSWLVRVYGPFTTAVMKVSFVSFALVRPHLLVNDLMGSDHGSGILGDILQRRIVRALLASAALASAIALAGCDTDNVTLPAKAVRPLSPDMVGELEHKNMPKDSPILVRIFKEESELEVWKQDADGKYAHLKTYPICRWSGELGPKVKAGDRQAPEGFYTITPAQMNPNSNYYLSFNLGFPNAYDKANDRSGAFLMVHGDCSSAGCYAMTDEQIGEIFALGRDSFFGGQKAFQVQAYPFRMTPVNMAKHRNSPNMAFWRMIKQGNDVFEVTRHEPKVDVCDKHYVFDAVSPGGAPINFSPRAACPAYQMPKEIAAAVKEKQAEDERKMAEHVQRGVPTVAVRTGSDGGMHSVFLARLRPNNPWDSYSNHTKVAGAQPGDMGNNVNPPREPGTDDSGAAAPMRAAASPMNESGSAEPTESAWNRLTASVSRAFNPQPTQPAQTETRVAAAPAPKAKPKQAQPTAVAQAAKPKPQQVTADSKPKPQQMAEAPSTQSDGGNASTPAQAPAQSNSFESRWSTSGFSR
jgi:murein L,D-transpeptidase YafK